MTWRDLWNAVRDPIRRRNVCSRIIEGLAGGLAVAAIPSAVWLTWWPLACAPLAPLVEFLVYEFLLEPAGLSGHYWERGPRDGEVFRWP